MLNKIANIITRRNSITQNDDQTDQTNLVVIFDKNLGLFDTIKDKQDRIKLFERNISHFKETFYNIDQEQAKDALVRSTLEKYCLYCAELGSSIVFNRPRLEEYVDSLIFIFHTYHDLPNSSKFISFFYDILQIMKKSPEVLDSTFGALTVLFRSKGFFRKFLKIDGYTLIYTSFYMKFVSKSSQDQFNHLLFDNVPKDFTSYHQQEGLLELFVSSLSSTKDSADLLNSSNDVITSSAVIFICNFLTTFHRFDPNIFTKFDDMHGFLNLNNFLISHQEIATACYKKMLIESNGSQSVISNLFILYTREQTKPELRTSLLNLLYTLSMPALAQASESTLSSTAQPQNPANTNNNNQSGWSLGIDMFKVSSLTNILSGTSENTNTTSSNTNENINTSSQQFRRFSSTPNIQPSVFSLDTIFQIAPIHLWLLPPPQLNREGLFLIAIYLKELSRSGTFPIKSSLTAILNIIKPPIKNANEVPVDSFLELIESAIVHKELAIQDLVDNKFIEDFILMPNDEDVAFYFEKHLIFRLIIIKIYSDKCASEFRFPVVQKFIMVSKYLKNMKDFIDFLSNLFSKHFSQQIIPLMLTFIKNKDLVTLFESELKKRGECYPYFIDCNGFIYLEEFMKSCPTQIDEIIRLIAALSYSCPKKEINEWLLKQPNDSPIFKYDKEFLGQAAFAFRTDITMLMIPSFFPFIQEAKFDTTNMMNLYFAGKYGVPMYKKLYGDKFKFENIPYINFISDRFIMPEDVPSIVNCDLSSSFIHRDLPHFSVYEFVPQLFRHSYFKIAPYNFVSIFFCFKHFTPFSVTVFQNKAFSIKVEADTFMIYTSKNQCIYNCIIQENKWNHIIFNFMNSKRRLEIEMDGNKLCAIDTTSGANTTINANSINNDLFNLTSAPVDGMNIIVGDEEKPIESHFLIAKKILVSDKTISDTRNIFLMSPAHSYKGLKDAHIEKIEFIFISHYQGFASYFNSTLTIEEIFLKFEKEKDLANLRVLYTFLLKLQVVNELSIGRFWDRLFLALKRQHELIKNELIDFAFHIPKAYYETNEMITKYLAFLLTDIEFFFVFPNDQLLHLLKFIKGEFETEFELDESSTNKLMFSISTAMRSGLEEQIVLQFIPILSVLIATYPSINKYRFFLNMAISSCDWNQAMSYTLSDFPAQILMDIELPPTSVSNALLVSFISLARQYDCELYSYNQLLSFMLLFEDERSLHFANLILHYSLKNPKYIKDSLLANYVFALHCDSKEFWIVAFSILMRKNSIGTIPKQSVSIEQKEFLPVIIEMLSRLCGIITSKVLAASSNLIAFTNDSNLELNSSNPEFESGSTKSESSDFLNLANSKEYLNISEYASCQNEIALTREIFDAILTINPDHYSYFLQNSCQIPLSILSNLGMLPKSITQNWERIKCEFLNFTPNYLLKEDIDAMINLCDPINPFSKMIKESEFVTNATTKNILFNQYLTFPFDLSSNEYISKLPFITNLLSLFSSILFSAAPNNFGSYLMDYATGHSIMYNCFARMFGQDLIFMTIVKLTVSDVPLDLYHKPLFTIIAKCIKDNLFDEKIIHLLSLVFGLLTTLQTKSLFKTMMKDQAVLTAYREIILGGFVILNGSKSLKELFTLFIKNQNVVFYSPLFENRDFSMICIHVTRINQLEDENAISCMEKFMKFIPENLLNEYKSEEVEAIWKATSVKYCKQFKDEQSTMNSKDKKSKLIQNYEQQKISYATNDLLFISLFRVCNHYIQSNNQIFRMNVRNKQYEASQYLISKLTRTFLLKKEFKVNSYRLASNPLPLYNSVSVSPSPYPIHTPKFEKKFNLDIFKIDSEIRPSRIEQIKQKGTFVCSPEWFYFHSHEEDYCSPFEYSSFIEQKPNLLLKAFIATYSKYGNYVSFHNVQFFYYIHTIPSVLMVTDRGIILLVLAELTTNSNGNVITNNENISYNDTEIKLIDEPQRPVAFLPLTESVSLNEYHHSSLFCGHIVLIIDYDRYIRSYIHLFIHQKTSLRLVSLYDPTTVVVFPSTYECEICDKTITKCALASRFIPFMQEIPFDNFVFSIESVQKANELWVTGKISNNDYLLLLNHFSGRSFSDLTQYPVFPWVVSPQLQPRDLSLPMGQLNKDRAAHFDTTYELSSPKYYYGFHYSIPGIVFWLLMRLPPFTFFQWDLNAGWDDQQRLFVSIIDAYHSAAVTNQSDLKELIPELYSVPEAFLNTSHLDFTGTEIKENVQLPDWSDHSPYKYIDVMKKRLENCDHLNEWIDLVFGYKETGEAALQAKNLFLPTCYHSATAENLNMDPPAFDAQVINFGQCPIQLFYKPHNARKQRKFQSIDFISLFSSKNKQQHDQENNNNNNDSNELTYKFVVNAVSNSQLLNNQKASSFNDNLNTSSLEIHIEDADNDSNIFIDDNSKSKAKIDEQAKIQNSRSSLFKNVALCDVGGYAMIPISCAIPPRFYHFVAIDTFQEILTLNSITSKKILFTYSSSIFAFAKNVSVSSSGMFCAVSFSSGIVNVYRIFYTEKEPTSIEHACSFGNMYDKCNFSSVFSQNFICVTACGEIHQEDEQTESTKNSNKQHTEDLIDFSIDKDEHHSNQMKTQSESQLTNNNNNNHFDDLIDLFVSSDKKGTNNTTNNMASVGNLNTLKHDDLIDFAFGDENQIKTDDTEISSTHHTNHHHHHHHHHNINSNSRLVFWNYATNLLQSVSHLDYKPVSMACDDVTNTLTIIGPRIIEQYTINGKKLHVYHFHDINKNNGQINELKTVSIMPFNFNFDGRLIVCGDKIGNLNFFVVDENSYELKFIHSKKIHIFPIISIFVLPNRNRIITNDTNGNKFITKLAIKEATQDSTLQLASQAMSSTSFSPEISSSSFAVSSSSQNLSNSKENSQSNDIDEDLVDLKSIQQNEQQKQSLIDDACYCAYCENVATVKCMNCGIPLCSNCVVDVKIKSKDGNTMKDMKLCQNCASEVQGSQNNGNQNDNDEIGNGSQNIPVSRRLSTFF